MPVTKMATGAYGKNVFRYCGVYYVRKGLIDWLVFNVNFSKISAISWHEQLLLA